MSGYINFAYNNYYNMGKFSDAFTIKDIFTSIALSLFMDIGMALISGVILWQMNTKLFVIIIFMTLISMVLVFIFKHPYKKINEEQMQQGNFVIKDDKRLLHMDYRGLKEENLCVEYQESGCRI